MDSKFIKDNKIKHAFWFTQFKVKQKTIRKLIIRHSIQEDKANTLLESILDYIKQIYLIISQIVFPPSY